MTTNDPIFHTKPISSSKGSTIRTNSKQKEPKRVDGRGLNQKRTKIRTPDKPTRLPPQPPWRPTPKLPKEGSRAQDDWQNSMNETMNATKLDETRQNSTTTTNEENKTALILHES